MQLTIYYMLVPTPALSEAARAAGEEWLLEPDVWTDAENDRTGRTYSQQRVEQAAWTVFLAKLRSSAPESDAERRFRERCLELGFAGCWTMYVARAGDPVGDLIAEADEIAASAADSSGRTEPPAV